jgi:type IV secretion system protein VirB5
MSDKKTNSENYENPYIAARQEWDDRYGSYIARARTWQVIGLVSMAIAGISVLINGWQATQSKVVPFIVEVDKLGQYHAYGVAEKTKLGDERFVKAQFVNFITDFRSVSSDTVLQRHRIFSAYKYVLKGSPANNMLDQFFNDPSNDPFAKSKEMTVTVQVNNVLQSSPNSYQIEWTETVRDARSGDVVFTENWKGIIEAELGKPSEDAAEIIKNPSGVYIKNFSMAKVI